MAWRFLGQGLRQGLASSRWAGPGIELIVQLAVGMAMTGEQRQHPWDGAALIRSARQRRLGMHMCLAQRRRPLPRRRMQHLVDAPQRGRQQHCQHQPPQQALHGRWRARVWDGAKHGGHGG